MIDYICMGCQARYNVKGTIDNFDFKWEIYKKFDLTEFNRIVNEGQEIPLDLEEKDELI